MQTSSPYQNMPVRNSEFVKDGVVSDIKLKNGKYQQIESWKTWGNDKQGTSSESQVGRRITKYDRECTPRNMLVSVVATSEKPSDIMLIFKSAYLSATSLTLGLSLLAAVSVPLAMSTI